MTTQPVSTITLQDGRQLAYSESGIPKGKPVFFFHGTPGSRKFRHPDDSIAIEAGARIVTVDRPGYGQSDPKPNRTLLDWPDDVARLADLLSIKRFAVAGVSGGGPYALACAFRLPDRVTHAGLISGLGPTDIPESAQGMSAFERSTYDWLRPRPNATRRIAQIQAMQLALLSRVPSVYVALIGPLSPPADRAVMKQPGVASVFREDIREAYISGGHGHVSDTMPLISTWGFALQDIRVPVLLWQGEADARVPRSMGEYMARTIPNCRATFYPGEGHLLFFTHWREIVTALTA